MVDTRLPEFGYGGWEMDALDVRPLIQDFLEHAE
jgi:hypothetical protein